MMRKTVWTILVVFVMLGCSKVDNKTITIEEDLSEAGRDTVDTESLVFWASDTAYSSNPELLLLLDTLYQHVRNDSFPDDVKVEEKWMNEYRSRLCAYYDSHKMGNVGISFYAKADTVLNEGVRLIELDDDWSTMGSIVKYSAEYTFDVLREYGLLSQLLEKVNRTETSDLIYKEWKLYEKMFERMNMIAYGVTHLRYWGGSAVGTSSTWNQLEISKYRREMYQNMLSIVGGGSWDCTDVSLDNAQQQLLDSSKNVVKEIVVNTENNQIDSPFTDEEDAARFKETAEGIELCIDDLSPLLKEWIVLWDKIDSKVNHSGSRHEMKRAASDMLIKWSDIVK